MVRMITVPLLVLFVFLMYFFFEPQLMKVIPWISGDGMMNWFAVARLEENEEWKTIEEMTRSKHPKTRYFAIQSCNRYGREAGLRELPKLIKDPSWEVRMTAIDISKARAWKPSGRALVDRLASKDPLGEKKRRWSFEREALLGALEACAAPDNAESLARLAIATDDRAAMLASRKALWPLGPLPQAEQAYTELMTDTTGRYRMGPEDRIAVLHAAAVLDLDGALPKLIDAARNDQANVQVEAVKSLGYLGGVGAKKFLETLANPPKWKDHTEWEDKKRKAAIRALERIKRKEQGLPDLEPAEPEEPDEPTDGGEGDPDVDDLLDAYGSDAVEPEEEEEKKEGTPGS